jgi:hypothetical protein
MNCRNRPYPVDPPLVFFRRIAVQSPCDSGYRSEAFDLAFQSRDHFPTFNARNAEKMGHRA